MTRLRQFTKRLIWLVVSTEKFELLNKKDYKKLVFVVSNANQWFAFVARRASQLAAIEKATTIGENLTSYFDVRSGAPF